MEIKDFDYYFDLSKFAHKNLFANCEYVFDFLKHLEGYIRANLNSAVLGKVLSGAIVEDNVYIGRNSVVQPGAWVRGPSIIGDNCEIRHGAYVGSNTLTGNGVIIGHASEVSNSVFLDNARAPHFAFVGHSILGNRVNLGAGTKLSNLKITAKEIELDNIKTGLLKLGAIIGDDSSLGCNTVTQPATFLGKKVFSYPETLLRGFIPSSTIIKLRQQQEITPFNEKI
ncbi:MAG: glucose-1-phosphate thymidylyltransferase [bacterium]|nr:glucose-1-phosphate thymidylyltransferase [bacterium]